MGVGTEVSTPIVADGVAGAELMCLEGWVHDFISTNAKPHFKTIGRWRGAFTLEALKRHGFKTPSLFYSCIGSAGTADTRGTITLPQIRFSAAILAKQGNSKELGGKQDRYLAGIAKCSIFYRLLHVMKPAQSQGWRRAEDIQWRNSYSKDLDKEGIAMFEFTWTHTLTLGDINIECLDDFLTLFGDIFPDSPDKDNVPVQGEVDFTP